MKLEETPLGVRNCCRCGQEFSITGQERVCSGCRKPRTHKGKDLSPHLSFREKQIVDLISQAKLNKEIAHALHLGEGTIKEYLHKIFRKLGVTNRTELAVWALVHPAECRVTPADADGAAIPAVPTWPNPVLVQ